MNEQMRFTMKKLAVSLGLMLCLAAGAFGYWHWRGSSTSGVVYRTAPVARADLLATIGATGTIEPEEVVDVGAQVAGLIKSFGSDPRDSSRTVDYGTEVEQGTVLAQIDDSLYKTQVDQAKANLQRAQADLLQLRAKLHQADRDWTRAKQLGPSKVISDLDYDTIQATYESSRSALAVGEASVAQAQAALSQAEINLGYTTIRSPVKGVIVDRRVNIGQTVVSSLNAPSLFLIAKDLKRLQVWASVNEADIGNIHQGQPVRFTVDAYPGQVFEGRVDQVRLNASMTQNVVTYTVVVVTDNSSGKLLPYLTANLQFEVQRRQNVLQVPNAALRWRPAAEQVAPEYRRGPTAGGRAATEAKTQPDNWVGQQKEPHAVRDVWVVDGAYVRPVKVKIGLNDGVNTEIVSGDLKDGDQVVTGETRPGSSDSTTNPFTPQLFSNKGKQ